MTVCNCGHWNEYPRTVCRVCNATLIPESVQDIWLGEQARMIRERNESYRRYERRQTIESALAALMLLIAFVIVWLSI